MAKDAERRGMSSDRSTAGLSLGMSRDAPSVNEQGSLSTVNKSTFFVGSL